MPTADLTIATCLDCPNHRRIDDPDPDDWFRDGDEAIICTGKPNPNQNSKGSRLTDRSPYRTVRGGLYGTLDVAVVAKIPDWCPLLSAIKSGKAPASTVFVFSSGPTGRLA